MPTRSASCRTAHASDLAPDMARLGRQATVFTVVAFVSVVRLLNAQALPAVEQLPLPYATTTGSFGYLAGLRVLPNRKVLINDALHRRLLLFDADLGHFEVVADSTTVNGSGTGVYGLTGSALVSGPADSIFLVDGRSSSMLVVDPTGRVARVAAIPRPGDVPRMASIAAGNDRQGRLIYRADFPRPIPRRDSTGAWTMPPTSDSAPIVRLNFKTRVVDTLSKIRAQGTRLVALTDSTGGLRMTRYVNPLPVLDDWGVFSDGTLAVIRGRDLRIEWIDDAGMTTRGPKIPFDWKPLPESIKAAVLDSMRRTMQRSSGADPPSDRPHGRAFQQAIDAPVDVNELPDYYPAFGTDAVRRDADNHLWIRSTTQNGIALGAVYYVIDRKGTLIRRVQLPAGFGIIGFGMNGVVFIA